MRQTRQFFRNYCILVLCVALSAVLYSCKEEFLHYRQDQPRDQQAQRQSVRELVGNTKIDILWVIDNSGSMGAYQQEVIRNADDFIQPFSKNSYGLDWKIGLISTDYRSQPYVGFDQDVLNSTTVDPVTKFRNAVGRLGISGWGYEQAFTPIMNALTGHPGFLRSGALLAIIVVTDAWEQSTAQFPRVQDFINNLKLYKPDFDQVVGYGILGPKDFGCASQLGEDDWSYRGSRYEEFFKALTSSKTFVLCKDDYGPLLADIGKDLVQRIENPRVFLKKRPKPETLRVEYKGSELKSGFPQDGGFWHYEVEQNAIIFHSLKFSTDDNAEVQIFFESDQPTD